MGEARGRVDVSDAKKQGKSRSRSRSKARKSKSEADLGSRFKGLIRGISKKSPRKKKSSASATSSVAGHTTISIQPIEEKTVTPIPEPPVEPLPPRTDAPFVQLVLLLMDPATRRFELLQLEFDSAKARVSDIIAQIPASVTETAIRQQKYEGVLDESSNKMDESVRLVEFCAGKQVLVALPQDLPVQECIRLARPILSDAQVVKMLKGSGFEVAGWEKKEAKEETSIPSAPIIETSSARSVVKGSSSKGSIFPAVAILALIAIVLQTAHDFISMPIEIGVPLPPGTTRSKCGLMGYLSKLDFLPLPPCTNHFLEVHDDGSVSLYDEDHEVDMLMKGEVCTKEGCVEGLLLEEDNTVWIGGKRVKSAVLYADDDSLAPWPFKEQPKMKVRLFNKATYSK